MVCAIPLVEEGKLVCDARGDELLDEGQGLGELLQVVQEGVLEAVKEDLPDTGRGEELFFEGQEDAIESWNPECWHLILDHWTQGGGHRIENSHLILQGSIAEMGLKNPCPDLPVSDCSILCVPYNAALLMLLFEHIWTNLFQLRFLPLGNLVGVQDVKKEHPGTEGFWKFLPHGKAGRVGSKNEIGFEDCQEDGAVSDKQADARDDEEGNQSQE